MRATGWTPSADTTGCEALAVTITDWTAPGSVGGAMSMYPTPLPRSTCCITA